MCSLPPQMPHYSTYSMPALSLHSGAHVSGRVCMDTAAAWPEPLTCVRLHPTS